MDVRVSLRWVIAALAVAAPCTVAGQSVARPELKVGDSWTYHIVNRPVWHSPGTTEEEVTQTVIRLLSDGYRIRTIRSDANRVSQMTLDGNPRDRAAADRDWREFKRVQWPLEPGRTWKFEFEQADASTPSVWTARVEEWAEITVPAGRFRAIKVELTRESLGASTSTARQTLWYAPEVKRFVRWESQTRAKALVTGDVYWELVRYDVK
jgi:hypothetical protein